MFANQPSWAHVGTARLYWRLTTLVAVTYLVVWTAVGLLIEDPWETGWMLVSIFLPPVLVAVCVSVWLACERMQRRGGLG